MCTPRLRLKVQLEQHNDASEIGDDLITRRSKRPSRASKYSAKNTILVTRGVNSFCPLLYDKEKYLF